jgi:hypothetical protein
MVQKSISKLSFRRNAPETEEEEEEEEEEEKPKRKLLLATDIDWPPYAYYIPGEAGTNGGLAGFGKDVAEGVGKICNLEITMMQTNWQNCWDAEGYKKGTPGTPPSPGVGQGLLNGWFDGCSTYTHAQGVRNRFMEFTHSILNQNKPAGLLTMLNKDGTPKVDGNSDLSGLRVVDVGGWVPTADGLMYVKNQCTGKKLAPKCSKPGGKDCYTLVVGDGNDKAMEMLRNGEADVMFVYADQAHNYECTPDGKTHSGAVPTWNCTLWKGFGKEYAYVQTGQFGHTINGTTLAISKKGSGLAKLLNPCIQEFLGTKEYKEICYKHHLVETCYKNKFFPGKVGTPDPWMIPTSKQEKSCANGYCGCPR